MTVCVYLPLCPVLYYRTDMTIFHSIFLGIVEGITEFLPISSTAHLIIASKFLYIPQTDFQKTFEIVIQLGAVLSVVVLYASSLLRKKKVWLKVLAAFIPTGIIGFVLHHFIKKFLIGNITVVTWSLFIGGILLIIFELLHREKEASIDDIAHLSYTKAALIGVFQALAVIPGVSRSAATIVGGMLLGIKRKTIVDFSFLLAIPTMLAASGLDLLKSGSEFSGDEYVQLAAGFITAFIVAYIVAKWFIRYVQKHSFIGFGIYRIVIAVLVGVMLMQGVMGS